MDIFDSIALEKERSFSTSAYVAMTSLYSELRIDKLIEEYKQVSQMVLCRLPDSKLPSIAGVALGDYYAKNEAALDAVAKRLIQQHNELHDAIQTCNDCLRDLDKFLANMHTSIHHIVTKSKSDILVPIPRRPAEPRAASPAEVEPVPVTEVTNASEKVYRPKPRNIEPSGDVEEVND